MARSFTVPQTANEPMSPPGKNKGRTTKVSVVIATRPAPSSSTALSCGGAVRAAPANAGRNRPSIRLRISRPPPPCASCTVACSLKGSGQLRLKALDMALKAFLWVVRGGTHHF